MLGSIPMPQWGQDGGIRAGLGARWAKKVVDMYRGFCNVMMGLIDVYYSRGFMVDQRWRYVYKEREFVMGFGSRLKTWSAVHIMIFAELANLVTYLSFCAGTFRVE
jgi:hypothetical protein